VGIVVILATAGIFVLLRAGAIREVNRNSITYVESVPGNFDEEVSPSTRSFRNGVFRAPIAMLLAKPGNSKSDCCIDFFCCSEICCSCLCALGS
ncbi:MAG: hypothetical protein VXW08_06030, partial [Candidatus Thermoplasmatota archaeon]|nr:hypothetical protein [Candidatus Thermoplasmatota archaeon]